MSCVRFLPARFSAGAASGAGRAAAQDMTSGCASSLRAGPFGAAHSGLPHFEMPQQPGNALHLCCHSSAPVICALRGTPQDLRAAFPQEPGVSYCVRPFRRGALLRGSWSSSRAVSPIRKSSHFLSGSPPFCPRHGDLVSDMEKKMPDRCPGYGFCGTERAAGRSACLPVFRFIIEDPGCGHGLLRVYRPFIRKGRRSFPGALERRAPAAARCFRIPNLHLS